MLSGIVFPEVFTTSAGEIQILFFLFMVFGGISFAEAINNFYCEILKFKNKSELQPLLKILYKKHVIFALLSIAIETGLVSVIYLRGVLALSEDEVQIISRFIAIAGGLTIAEVVNAFSIWRMLPAKVKKEKKVK